jgi:ZPR1 zinc-finger domain
LHRQIIKSDYASITFPEIDFEVPPKTQQGEITTVEGLLSTAATRLGYEQQHRMETDPTVGLAVAEVISKVGIDSTRTAASSSSSAHSSCTQRKQLQYRVTAGTGAGSQQFLQYASRSAV